MINLNDETDYFILVDGQGGTFGGGRIFEGINEVIEQFEEWADNDGNDISTYTVSDMLELWVFELKKYDCIDFVEVLDQKILNHKK